MAVLLWFLSAMFSLKTRRPGFLESAFDVFPDSFSDDEAKRPKDPRLTKVSQIWVAHNCLIKAMVEKERSAHPQRMNVIQRLEAEHRNDNRLTNRRAFALTFLSPFGVMASNSKSRFVE
jgi:hypothetical protein